MLLHYLGKLKNQNCNFHARKTRFKCDFLSSIQQTSAKRHKNKCKDWHHAKYQHFAFRSFTVLNVLKECLIVVWSDFPQIIIDFAVDQWRKRLQACVRANGAHFEQFVNKLLQTISIFHVFLVQVGSIHRVSFLLFWCLMVSRPTMLNCKALSLLRTVNKQKVNCWYFAWC